MKKQKYYYQRGMCIAIGYNSLNPVIYETTGENIDYHKKQMCCSAITLGKCINPEQCQLLQDAPKQIPYNSFELYEKKLS